MPLNRLFCFFIFLVFAAGCGKKTEQLPPPQPFHGNGVMINGVTSNRYNNISINPIISAAFTSPVAAASVNTSINFQDASGTAIPFTSSMQNDNYAIAVQPAITLKGFTEYTITIKTALRSTGGGALEAPVTIVFTTGMDFTDKFPEVSDSVLLDLVQKQTFKYFWDFGHPVSGLARERNSSGDIVTSGGTGFGIMSLVVAVNRNFISRAEGLGRMQKIVGFLKNKAIRTKGAFSHWLNGSTGAIVPFSAKDNGADLVETSFLMQGLLTARQYFSNADAGETTLRADINMLWNEVQWNWFQKNSENQLYWHYSESFFLGYQPAGERMERMPGHLCAGSCFSNLCDSEIYL